MEANVDLGYDATMAALDDQEIAAILNERRAMDSEPPAVVAARFGIDLDA